MGVTGKINSIFKAGLSSNFRRITCPPIVSVSKFYLACPAVQVLALLFLKIYYIAYNLRFRIDFLYMTII